MIQKLTPPSLPGRTTEEKVQNLSAYLFELVGELNLILQEMDHGAFATTVTGASNDIATGSVTVTSKANGEIDMNGHGIHNLPMPVNGSDAATVAFVQQYVNGRSGK